MADPDLERAREERDMARRYARDLEHELGRARAECQRLKRAMHRSVQRRRRLRRVIDGPQRIMARIRARVRR